jgi:hypothetical protein
MENNIILYPIVCHGGHQKTPVADMCSCPVNYVSRICFQKNYETDVRIDFQISIVCDKEVHILNAFKIARPESELV